MPRGKDKQITLLIPYSLHIELKKIAKNEGKLLTRVTQEIIQQGLEAKQVQATAAA